MGSRRERRLFAACRLDSRAVGFAVEGRGVGSKEVEGTVEGCVLVFPRNCGGNGELVADVNARRASS